MADPFVLALFFPPEPDEENLSSLRAVAPGIEIVAAPYFEPEELRTAHGENAGVAPESLAHLVPLTDEHREALARANGLVTLDLPPDLDQIAPRLRWVQAFGAGVDHLDLDLLRRMDVMLTNASGVAAGPMAEFVMARLLEVWKQLRSLEEQQRDHQWRPRFGAEMAGKTLGIVGLGAIGRAVARRARAFECTVLATRRSAEPDDTDPDVDELFPAKAVATMAGRSDALVVCAPSTPETRNLIDADLLALMPRGAILCNVARRGELVDEPALIAALASGHLGAAVLDVTRNEPLPADDPLWTAPNCYISPHCSASLDGYYDRLFAIVARNLGAVVGGETPVNVVLAPGGR